jgi:hypothetical protein
MTEPVLEQMQVLDQQIAFTGPAPQQLPHLGQRADVHLPAQAEAFLRPEPG